MKYSFMVTLWLLTETLRKEAQRDYLKDGFQLAKLKNLDNQEQKKKFSAQYLKKATQRIEESK